jgi:hypothetical protein
LNCGHNDEKSDRIAKILLTIVWQFFALNCTVEKMFGKGKIRRLAMRPSWGRMDPEGARPKNQKPAGRDSVEP